MRNYFHFKYSIFAKLGSFWHKLIGGRDEVNKARVFSHLPSKSSLVSAFGNIPDIVSNTTRGIYNYDTIRTSIKDLLTVNKALLNNRQVTELATSNETFYISRVDATEEYNNWSLLSTESSAYTVFNTENCKYLLFPSPTNAETVTLSFEEVQVYYALPLPFGVVPTIVSTKERDMLIGIDFAVSAGVIVFKDYPDWLEDNVLVCKSVTKTVKSIYNSLLEVDNVAGNCNFIFDYYRSKQSLRILGLAAAQSAGLAITPQTGTLLRLAANCNGYDYFFDYGKVKAPYSHTPLVVNTIYPNSTIIGQDEFKLVYQKGGAEGAYWKTLPWADGINLKEYSHFDLVIPNTSIRIDASTLSATRSKYHVKPQLLGKPEVLAKYWEFIATQEDNTDLFLNDVLGLASGGSTYINFLNFYFEQYLRGTAVILHLDIGKLGKEISDKIEYFVQKERPINSVLIKHYVN